jgi:aldose 1-epimerase
MQMITEFGRMADGRAVQAVDLRGGALSVRLLTLGSALQDARVQGAAHGLTLGLRSLADYQAPGGQWFGTLVGPVANRLAGAAAPLDGPRPGTWPRTKGRTCCTRAPAGCTGGCGGSRITATTA